MDSGVRSVPVDSLGSRGAWIGVALLLVVVGIALLSDQQAQASLTDAQRARQAEITSDLKNAVRGDFILMADHRLLMVQHQRDKMFRLIHGFGGTPQEYHFDRTWQLASIERVITPADRDYTELLVAFARE